MDKYEYKVRAEEIKSLIEERRYPEAMAIADTIDWRKVKSVSMLCDISDLYNVNRKFEVARDVLELAYARHPEGRRIVYSLCELSIKMGDVVQAVEYYKEFVRVAPRDTGRYILQYKIYEAQDVSIEERIAILEELKKRDYREKWAYELAFLYHRAGLATQCVEECDELALWFGEGTYVKKAMELKMLHQPLSDGQRDRYNLMTGAATTNMSAEPEIRVKTVDTSIYNTFNLQRELAENLEKVLAEDLDQSEDVVAVHAQNTGMVPPIPVEKISMPQNNVLDFISSEAEPEQQYVQEQPYQAMDMVDLSVDNQVYEQPEEQQEQYYPVEELYQEQVQEEIQIAQEQYPAGETKIYRPEEMEQLRQASVQMELPQEEIEPEQQVYQNEAISEVPSGFEELLSQEYDGQISLVVPEEESVDKQITGQLSIEDVLAEWERMKRQNEQKRQEEVRKRVLEHTGSLIKEFERENTKDAMLNSLAEDEEADEDFEELEEIRENTFEEDDSDLSEEASEIHLDATAVAAGLVGGAATAAAGMAIAQAVKKVADEAKAGIQMTGAIAGTDMEEMAPLGEMIPDDSEEASEEVENSAEDGLPVVDKTGEFTEEFAEEMEPIVDEIEQELQNFNEASEEVYEDGVEDGVIEESEEETEDHFEAYADENIEEMPEDVDSEEVTYEETMYEESAYEESGYEEPAYEEAAEDIYEEDSMEMQQEPQDLGMTDLGEEEATGESFYERQLAMDEVIRNTRDFTPEEEEIFGDFLRTKRAKDQLIYAIDNVSMASYTGNIIITGDNQEENMELAKSLTKEVQLNDPDFSGTLAKISASSLNHKDVDSILRKVDQGAVIIYRAGVLTRETVNGITNALEQENRGIILILVDTKMNMDKLLSMNPSLRNNFNARIDIEEMTTAELQAYGKAYAYEREYSIDEMGMLELYYRIEQLQTMGHAVTQEEVEDIIEGAIKKANRANLKHFTDVIFYKRYDAEDMIILKAKDFIENKRLATRV